MKQTFKTATVVIAVLLAAISCTKEIEVPRASEGSLNISIQGVINDLTPAAEVKATAGTVVRVNWAEGDKVYVYDGTDCLGTLTVSLKDGDTRYAYLSNEGFISSPDPGTTKLTLVYASNVTQAPAVIDGQIKIDLSNQDGADFPFVLYGTLDYTSGQTTITDEFVPFHFATSVIKVNCTGLKPGTAITSATLSNVNTACKLTLSGNAAPTVPGDINGTITRTGDEYFAATKVNAEGEAVFQIAVPALETASEERVLTVEQGSDKVEDKNFTKKALSAATSVNTVCQLVKALPAGALPGVFTVSDNGGETTKQIYFSQGNLYYDGSKFNFEANQYGFNSSYQSTYVSHFYWSKDVEEAVKQDFNWGQSMSAGDVFFTNADGFKVNVGGKEQSGWRTLSTAEWQYLFNNHSKKWVSVDGVNGYVIAPDGFSGELSDTYADDAELATAGNLVFLPAAGYRNGSFVGLVGDFGYYWSSNAYDENYAYIVFFNSSDVRPDDSDSRSYGFGVRLITESN